MQNHNLNRGLLIATLLVAVIVLCQHGTASSPSQHDIKLDRPDGTQVLVPASGPLANDNARSVAISIQSFDQETTRWQKKQHRIRSANPEVIAAMQAIAIEERNDSVDHLDLTYRIAQQTSGSLDLGLISRAAKEIDSAKSVLQTTPPENILVETNITTPVGSGSLHFCAKRDYKGSDTQWHTYDPGTKYRIGNYIFFTDPIPPSNKPYQEEVLILAEPTLHKIVPIP